MYSRGAQGRWKFCAGEYNSSLFLYNCRTAAGGIPASDIEDDMSFIRISAEQARDLIADNALVVDIRDPQSYAAGSIENAVHIDGDNVDEFIAASDLGRPLIVCCYHGNTSQSAAAYFSENGFLQTYSLDGGYEAWQELQENP